MRATALVDIGTGHVYKIPCATVAEARRHARSPHAGGLGRTVVKTVAWIELYERGEKITREDIILTSAIS